MVQVTELGYVILGVSDLARWKTFASEILGLEVMPGDRPDRCFLRMDYWHHRVILQQSPADDLLLHGLRVAGSDEFHELAARLKAAGVPVQIGSLQQAMERHVLEVMMLKDVNGYEMEIFHGPHILADIPFHPGRRMHGRFQTGDGGLGHMMLTNSLPLSEIYAFYRLLGMRGGIEYRVVVPHLPHPAELMFLHCNTRDHSLAFGTPGKKRINHLMFQVEHMDDVGLAYERVKQAGYKVGIEPGRHANDQMYSFYCMNPSGWLSEIGWGGRNSVHQTEYYERDTFGHENVEGVVGEGMEPLG
jgi:2,3-dihydroxyethylbenzene 1,2-dioxygenase